MKSLSCKKNHFWLFYTKIQFLKKLNFFKFFDLRDYFFSSTYFASAWKKIVFFKFFENITPKLSPRFSPTKKYLKLEILKQNEIHEYLKNFTPPSLPPYQDLLHQNHSLAILLTKWKIINFDSNLFSYIFKRISNCFSRLNVNCFGCIFDILVRFEKCTKSLTFVTPLNSFYVKIWINSFQFTYCFI